MFLSANDDCESFDSFHLSYTPEGFPHFWGRFDDTTEAFLAWVLDRPSAADLRLISNYLEYYFQAPAWYSPLERAKALRKLLESFPCFYIRGLKQILAIGESLDLDPIDLKLLKELFGS